MQTIDYWIVGGYLLLVLTIGLNAGRKVNSLKQFSIADARYGPLVVFATLSASFIGGGFTMGNAAQVYMIGIVNIAAIWGFSIKEILVSQYLAPRMTRFPNAMSAGDITGQAYGKPIKVLTGIFGMLLCIGIVGAQVGAMGAVFSVFLGMDPLWGIGIGCGILIMYSTFGGMKAVVVTDIAQFAVLAIGLPLVLVFGVMAVGGVGATIEAIPETHFQLFSNKSIPAFISLFLVLFLGEALVPPYLQRLMIGKPRDVSRGTLLSGIFSIPFFAITGCIGLVALAMNSGLEHTNHAIPYVVNEAVPWGIKGLVIAGILSVSMSSADSFLNSTSVCLSNDVIKPLRRVPLTMKQELLVARCTTALGGIAAIIFTIYIEGLLDILIYAYNFWAPVVLPPMVAAFFGFRASSRTVFIAAGFGIATNMVWTHLLHSPWEFDGLIPGVLANAIVLLVSKSLRAKTTSGE